MSVPTVTTTGGLELPVVGLGTYQLTGTAGVVAIDVAIEAGYRLLDSAVNYENEGAVGAAVRAAAVDRRELIVTSKLPGRHHAYDEALTCIQESVYRTGLDAIDLYLIHWPLPRVDRYVEAWRALLDARERGLVRHVGVSNFLPEHLDRLIEETRIVPEVNQIELHPYFPQTEALAYHRDHGIVTEAWSPLGRGTALLAEPVLREIAERLGVSSAQVVLAWHLALGDVSLPKSSSLDRQRQNLDIFSITLSDNDIARITALGRPDGRAKGLDPATHEEF